ncbi:hypothetical protein NEOLEDRAFT_1067762 [Neolentinus lepideus HHB14362 ss-1]|uniref:F-box domain-containing protein n=1 Tax=Neolentinus lepideus HHB14362 ss-1 TaxID=1314782 RepID=A0A165RRL5_9AGAM|nr:hypothetical protein NEOLEDRAFT_1067762 [Neolentinus lepideus HHB14362 ss-1]
MAVFSETVVQRVLSIFELRDMVLSYNDPPTNAVCARVCRAWYEPVMSLLWGQVSDLSLLFGLLGPLWQCDEQEYGGFSAYHIPGPQDWETFLRNGKRVRSLVYDTTRKTSKIIRTELFDVVARTRTRLKILPCLKELTWITNDYEQLDASILFMHGGVSKLVFSLPPIPEDQVVASLEKLRSFCENVISRMPELAHLDIRVRGSPVSIRSFEPFVLELIGGLPKLEIITLPNYWITTEVLNEVSKLQNLAVLQYEDTRAQGEGLRSDVESLFPIFDEGAFPSLWDLSLSTRLSSLTGVLNSPYAPSHLTTLAVHSLVMETATAIQQFFEALAQSCQGLQDLYVVAIDVTSPLRQSEERITLRTIEPLFGCTRIKTFELMHEYPMSMYQEDMEVIATKWPLLENLKLDSEPFSAEKSPLTLRALLPFATHCPNLQFLGLYVDATTADLPSSAPPFRRLRRLSLGLSSVQEPGPVTIFLARVCPLGCRIESGATWAARWDADGWEEFGEQTGCQEGLREWGRRCAIWEEVDRMVPLVVKARMDDRSRMVEMRKKIYDLEARNSVLEDGGDMIKDNGCIIC